jgi:hypothetical protein
MSMSVASLNRILRNYVPRVEEREPSAERLRKGIKREPSINEALRRKYVDTQTCFHGVSYTMPCRQCRRSETEALRNRERVSALLSIA